MKVRYSVYSEDGTLLCRTKTGSMSIALKAAEQQLFLLRVNRIVCYKVSPAKACMVVVYQELREHWWQDWRIPNTHNFQPRALWIVRSGPRDPDFEICHGSVQDYRKWLACSGYYGRDVVALTNEGTLVSGKLIGHRAMSKSKNAIPVVEVGNGLVTYPFGLLFAKEDAVMQVIEKYGVKELYDMYSCLHTRRL